MSEVSFELTAGALCLDFVNTQGDRTRPQSDRLRGYDDLLAFAFQAAALSEEEAGRLARRARRNGSERDAVYARALELRDALYRLFHAPAEGTGDGLRSSISPDLRRLNRQLQQAMSCLQVEPRGSAYTWSWTGRDAALESPLWRVAHSAAELLTGDELDRVRECDGTTCTWLFLDRSRNRSRRWCAMASCGNRAKARRHYSRRRKSDTS